MRKLKFDLVIDNSAELAPNAEAFFSQAYLSSDIVDNFRTLPGVKYKTKLGTVTFGTPLAPQNCGFAASTDNLSSVEIDVCSLSSMTEICQFDLEQSFVSLQMTQGSNGDFSVASFMNFYWSELANAINGNIESLRWQGDTNTPGTLDLCDGYEVKLAAELFPAGAVIDGNTNTLNVITDFATLLIAINNAFAVVPATIASRNADLRIYMPTNLVNIYRLGVAQGNTNAFITQDLALSYLGIKIVLCPGMSNDKFVITLKDNLIYAFDAEGDPSDLRAINLRDTVAEPVIRTRADMKIGFSFVNPGDIVFYS